MKMYRNIIIAVVIILILVLPEVIYDKLNMEQMSLNYPVTQELYNELKDYAYKYAKTLDKTSIESDEIKIQAQNDNNALNVTVDSKIATVQASFPISMKLEKTANGVEVKAEMVYEEAKYTEISKVHPKYFYIIGAFLISCLIGFGIYCVFYMLPCEFFWNIKK